MILEKDINKIYGAVLGEAYLNGGQKFTISSINRYLKQLGQERLKREDVEGLVEALKEQQQPLYDAYVAVGSGKKTLTDYLDVSNPCRVYDHVTPTIVNKVSLQESQREFKNDLRVGAYSKMLADKNRKAIIDMLASLDLSMFSEPADVKDSDQALVLNLSDLHIGELDDLKVGSYHNIYNLSVLKKRLRIYVDTALNYARANGITNIVVINIGDIITGGYMHPNQLFSIEFDISHQIAEAIKIMLSLLNKLNSEFKVTFGSIAGNHDRINQKDKAGNIPSDSAAYIVMDTINTIKKTTGALENVTLIDNFDDMHEIDLTINDKRIVWTHGEKVKRGKNDNAYKFQAGGKHVDCLIYGHFHTFQIKSGDLCQEVGLPALKGMDSYAKSLPTEFSAPGQCFTIVPKDGNIYTIPVLFKGDEFE